MFARRLLTPGAAALFAAVLVFAACSDNRDRGLITAPGSPASLEAAPDLDTQISSLIDQFYSGGPRTAVRARWENVKRQSMKNRSGRAQHVQLVAWIQSQTAAITPAADETRDHAAARLALLMSLYVYGGPETEPPVISPGSDATLEIVEAGEPDTVITPAEKASVVFPEGATSEPTIMVVAENEEEFPAECSGPLPTTRCQYPLFYKFNAFPNVKLNKAVTVAVCHVNHGNRRTPLADHERFRLAHEKPADPSANHPEGRIEEGIEILPLTSVGELLECEETEDPHDHAALSSERGTFASLVTRARWRAGRVAKAVGKMLTPKSLYAIDRGGGGEVIMFSNFNVVDPESRPDVTPGQELSVSETRLAPEQQVSVGALNVTNIGAAAAVQVSAEIVLADDAALTANAVVLHTFPALAALPPKQVATLDATTVAIPSGTEGAAYFLGVRVKAAGLHAESDVSNNYVSVAVTVGGNDPTSLFCPDGPEGSFSNLRGAIVNTRAGGTVYVCDGTHDVDMVVVDKPLTLTSQNEGGNAWIGDVPDAPQGVNATRPALVIDGYAEGLVRIVDVGFRFKGPAIWIGRPSSSPDEGATWVHPGLWDRVEIHNARFLGRGSSGLGVRVHQNRAGVGRVDVTNSHFDTFGIGVWSVSHSETNVSHSTFENFTSGSVTHSGFTSGRDPSLFKLSFGRIEDNVIRNCGPNGCIRGVLMQSGTIARNTIEAGLGGSKLLGILATPHPQSPHARSPIIIEDNVIISAGVLNPENPNDPFSWGIRDGIQVFDPSGTTHVVRRNQIMNAHTGVNMNGSADLSDNKIGGGVFGFRQGLGTTRVSRNDIVGTSGSYTIPPNAVGDYRCNWWGSTNGPTNPPPHGQYAPWATEPVAGTDATCNPDVDMTTVRACPTGPTGGDPWTFRTIPQAYNHMTAGGTVLVCDGTHAVQNLQMRKSGTVRSEGEGRPVIDAGGAGNAFVLQSQPQAPVAADVTIRGLKIQNAAFNGIVVSQNYGRLLVDDVAFLPAHGPVAEGGQLAYSDGVGVFSAVGNGVTVQHSSFTGGDIGVHQNNSANVTVLNSIFLNQMNAAIHAGSGGSIRAEGNTITGCGPNWCIGVFGGGTVALVDNSVTVDFARPVLTAMQLHGGTYTLTGNVITGTGGPRNVNDHTTWPILNAINLAGTGTPGSGIGTINGNRVSGAHTALNLHEGSTGTGSDNVISDVRDGMFFWRSSFALSRSDITNYYQPIAYAFESPNASAKCNWWGAADGPERMPEGVSPSVYTPFAQQPIANTTVGCDPDVVFNTVRACPTGGNGSADFRVSSVASAYNLVSAGGTVLICDGAHNVANLDVRKSVSFVAESGMPTLDAGGAFSVFRAFGSPVDVAVRGLRLRGAVEHTIHVNEIRSLVVESSELHPFQTHAYNPSRETYRENWMSGVGAFGNIGNVTVASSTFIGGDIGVHANVGCCTQSGTGGGTLTVRSSRFTGQSNAGVFTGGTSASYRLRVENNTFEECGRMGCTKVFGQGGGRAEYVNNRFTVNATRPVFAPINIGMNPGGTALVADNTIEGNGGGGDRFQQSSYPIDGFAIQFAGQSIEATRNHAGNAHTFLNLSPGSVTGSDNIVSRTAFVITGFSETRNNTVLWQRNDVTDFVQIMPGVGDFASVNLRCNWWGSADGPTNPGQTGATTPEMYTPWAAQPIAGRPEVNCS